MRVWTGLDRFQPVFLGLSFPAIRFSALRSIRNYAVWPESISQVSKGAEKDSDRASIFSACGTRAWHKINNKRQYGSCQNISIAWTTASMEGIWARHISICFTVTEGPWAFWFCPHLVIPSVDNFRDVWGSFPNLARWQRRVAGWPRTAGGKLFFLGASGNTRHDGMYLSTLIWSIFIVWKLKISVGPGKPTTKYNKSNHIYLHRICQYMCYIVLLCWISFGNSWMVLQTLSNMLVPMGEHDVDWISSTSCLYTSCNAIVLWWPSSPTSDQSNINHTPGTGEGIGWLGGQTMVSVALRTFTPPWMYCRHMLAHRDLCWFTATCFIASTLTACFSVASVVGYTHMCMQRQKGKKQTVQSLVSISFSFHRHPDGSTCGSLCIFPVDIYTSDI